MQGVVSTPLDGCGGVATSVAGVGRLCEQVASLLSLVLSTGCVFKVALVDASGVLARQGVYGGGTRCCALFRLVLDTMSCVGGCWGR